MRTCEDVESLIRGGGVVQLVCRKGLQQLGGEGIAAVQVLLQPCRQVALRHRLQGLSTWNRLLIVSNHSTRTCSCTADGPYSTRPKSNQSRAVHESKDTILVLHTLCHKHSLRWTCCTCPSHVTRGCGRTAACCRGIIILGVRLRAGLRNEPQGLGVLDAHAVLHHMKHHRVRVAHDEQGP